jgi:hypothetical protein
MQDSVYEYLVIIGWLDKGMEWLIQLSTLWELLWERYTFFNCELVRVKIEVHAYHIIVNIYGVCLRWVSNTFSSNEV